MFEGRRWMAQLQHREILPFLLSFPWAPQRVEWCPPTLGRQYSLYSLPTQRLASSRNTLTHILRNNVLPTLWAPLSPVDVDTQNLSSQHLSSRSDTPNLTGCQSIGHGRASGPPGREGGILTQLQESGALQKGR